MGQDHAHSLLLCMGTGVGRFKRRCACAASGELHTGFGWRASFDVPKLAVLYLIYNKTVVTQLTCLITRIISKPKKSPALDIQERYCDDVTL